jgi:putative transcriptional regulator
MRRTPNPKAIREALGLSQRQFARQFQIALGTLRDWEQGVRRPDSAGRAYLRVIQEHPDAVLDSLGNRPGKTPQRTHPERPARMIVVSDMSGSVAEYTKGVTRSTTLPIEVENRAA